MPPLPLQLTNPGVQFAVVEVHEVFDFLLFVEVVALDTHLYVCNRMVEDFDSHVHAVYLTCFLEKWP